MIMNKFILSISLLFTVSISIQAQTDPATGVITGPMGGPMAGPMVGAMPLFPGQGMDVSFGATTGISNFGLSYSWWHSFYTFARFGVSSGYRLNNQGYDNGKFTIKDNPNNTFPKYATITGQVGNLNLMFSGEIEPLPGFGIGFNMDVVGYSFGDVVVEGLSNSSGGISKAIVAPAVKVPEFNLLLGPNNDLGNLNSEFYLYFLKAPFMQVRVGLSHFYSSMKIGEERKIYQTYFNIPFVAFRVSY
jgi:hypothetical protein